MNTQAMLQQASAAMKQGDFSAAAPIFQQIIQADKSVIPAYFGLASVYFKQHNFSAVEETCRAAIEIAPNADNIHAVLGQSLWVEKKYKPAREAMEQSVALNQDNVMYYNNLGACLFDMGKYLEAEEIFKKVIEKAPELTGGYANVGHLLSIRGKKKEAVHFLEKALEIEPGYIPGHSLLSFVKEYESEDDPHIKAMKSLLETTKLPPINTGQIHLALGCAYDNLDNYDTAFRHYKKGNKLIKEGKNYDFSSQENRFKTMKAKANNDFLKKHKDSGIDNYSPIFIFGMPRSGTSLLEQILSSHPDVFGAGELGYLQECADNYGFMSGNPDIKAMAGYYKGRLDALRTDKKRITDKMPGNFFYVPLIKTMFPNAKVINTRRDPMDSCFSMYKIFFTEGLNWAYDLEILGCYYNMYDDLINHYHKLMPGFILDIVYEDVVDDLEGQTKKILEFCDLPWDEKCLSFHETEREVVTASSLQVKQPLYKGSVGAWKKYEKHLGPLKKIIESKNNEST